MNAQRRKQLAAMVSELDDIRSRLETLAEEEREAFDAMPDAFKDSDKGQDREALCDLLTDQLDTLQEVMDVLEEAQQ